MSTMELKQLTQSNWARYRKSVANFSNLTKLYHTRVRENASTLELSEYEALFEDYKGTEELAKKQWFSTLNVLRLAGHSPQDFLGE